MPKRASTPEDDELDDLIEQTRNLMMQKISSSSGTDDFEGLTTFPVNITTLAKLTKAGEPSWDFVPLMVDAIDNERIPMKMIMRALIGFDDIEEFLTCETPLLAILLGDGQKFKVTLIGFKTTTTNCITELYMVLKEVEPFDADFPSEDEDPFADIIDPEDCTKFFPLSSIVSWGPYVGGFTEYRNGVTSLVIERDTSMLKVENHDYCYSCNVRAVSPAWSVRSGGSGDASGEVEDLAAAMDGLNTEDDVWAKMTAGAEFNFKFDPKKAEQEMNP